MHVLRSLRGERAAWRLPKLRRQFRAAANPPIRYVGQTPRFDQPGSARRTLRPELNAGKDPAQPVQHFLNLHFAQIFPFYLGALWLVVTTMLGQLSGWFVLQNRYPARPAQVLQKLSFQSAAIGKGAVIPRTSFNSILTVTICVEGLKIDIMRIFGPFSRAFFVPWEDITLTTRKTMFGQTVADLAFGNPAIATMTARRRLADRLRTASAEAAGLGSQ